MNERDGIQDSQDSGSSRHQIDSYAQLQYLVAAYI